MKIYNKIFILATIFFVMHQQTNAMDQQTTPVTPDQQYELDYTNYWKTVEFWKNKPLRMYTATLPKLIVPATNHTMVRQTTRKLPCYDSNSGFDECSRCFCVQRWYAITREYERIYSTQIDRFDILKNITETTTTLQAAPSESFARTFKKDLETKIISLCAEQKPALKKVPCSIWSPDYLKVAFVIIDETFESDDSIIVMTPMREYPISPSRGADTSFNFK